MRILHTSDWHLGRSFHRVGMLTHQEAYVDHLLQVVEAEGVDVVVVAGDVYDRALPPVDAVRLFDDTLARLMSSRAQVVISSGNHDSAQRLGFGSRVMAGAGIHVRTSLADVGTPVLLEDDHGPVAFHALPYLDPEAVREPWGLLHRSHEVALGEAMLRVRADLGRRRGVRSVVSAHAFVAKVAGRPVESDSERDISVGGVSIAPASLFDGIDYVALGHLHRPQSLTERMHYSGSPLAYSFSEAGQVKGSWLVDLGADGAVDTEFVPAAVPRALAVLQGDLEDLLTDARHAEHEQSWLQVVLTDAVRPQDAMERVRARFPHTLALSFAPAGARAVPDVATAARMQGRSDLDIALGFVDDLRGAPATTSEFDLLREAVESCCVDPDADPVQVPR